MALLSSHEADNNLLDDIFSVLIFCLKLHAEYFRDFKILFAKSSDSLTSYWRPPLQKKKIPPNTILSKQSELSLIPPPAVYKSHYDTF